MLQKLSFHPRLLKRKQTWFTIIAAAFLIAVGISAIPGVECAFGQCGSRDQWCNGDCSQTCQPATRLGYVDSCNLSADGTICTDGWHPNQAAVRCTSASNCNVTQALAESGRLHPNVGGYSEWNVSRCNRTPTPAGTCSAPTSRWVRVDCCTAGSGGGGGGGGGGGCTPQYDPPTIALAGHTPPYPLVIGQDPNEIGFDATVVVTGGHKNNGCASGTDQQDLSSINLDSLELSEASVTWITTELAQIYPGADLLDHYPQHPNFTTNINGTTGSLFFHHDPLDPGYYDIQVTAVQANGQQATQVLQIPVYLLEATLIH